MDELIALLRREIRLAGEIGPDTSLLASGLIDSFHLTLLLTALESHYRVQIDPGDVGADNFDTARQILAFVEGLR
jgi:acyl carrier protein